MHVLETVSESAGLVHTVGSVWQLQLITTLLGPQVEGHYGSQCSVTESAITLPSDSETWWQYFSHKVTISATMCSVGLGL